MNSSDQRSGSSTAEPGKSRSWRTLRRILLGLAILSTVVAVVHTIENWRGRRAWAKCAHELAAKGEVLNWAAYIPPSVPADQNVYRAPKIEAWFIRDSLRTSAPSGQLDSPLQEHLGELQQVYLTDKTPVVLASIQWNNGKDPLLAADTVLRLDDANVQEKAAAVVDELAKAIAPKASMGWFVAEWPINRKPLNIIVQAKERPTLEGLKNIFLPTHRSIAQAFLIVADGTNSFRMQLVNQSVYLAADYLKWTAPGTNDIELIRTALDRPRSHIDGTYEEPFAGPIPNFVTIRTVAQRLSERAQCHLLLGNPEAAFEELTLVHKMSKFTDSEPTTLVAAMIDVAVTGLYSSMVQEGLRLKAWREPQLIELQRQLSDTCLISKLTRALRTERAAVSRVLEVSSAARFLELGDRSRRPGRASEKLKDAVASGLFPRGWMDQNRAVLALHEQEALECFDPTNQLVINPRQLNRTINGLEERLARYSPYTVLARIAVPNLRRAATVAAQNQALARCTLAACALERYRAKHSEYPASLEALVPEFVSQVPQDPMTGNSLKYRRTAQGIVLYSVGWNQQDDGATPGGVPEEGDWVSQVSY